MKMTVCALCSLVIGALTLIPAPAILAAQVTFTFENGNNGTVDGVEYGSQDPQGFAALHRDGFVIDVKPSGPINGNLHWREVDSGGHWQSPRSSLG
jgi:hypothetical protein